MVTSNCVINPEADKRAILVEASGPSTRGRFAISAVVADPEMDEATRRDMAVWAGCSHRAGTEAEYCDALEAAG